MRSILLATTALAMTAPAAFAGGIERTTQSTGILFEDGRYFETSLSFGSPSVSGVGQAPGPNDGVTSGDITESYLNFGFAYKADLNDTWSYALIYDQPYGADVFYPSVSTYTFQGSFADFNSHALTGILEYNMPSNVSLYAGLRAQTIEAEAQVTAGYNVVGDRDLSFGYLLGASYEKPEIALRVALTYISEIKHDLDTLENGAAASVTPITTPQAVNLEFQTGVAEDTLVFGSIRWVEWTKFAIAPEQYLLIPAFGGRPLVEFLDDRTTFTLGVGRRLNETWSVLGSVGYEETTGSTTGNLGPTDGLKSIALGAIYNKDNMKITGGVRYVDLGPATTTINARFSGNHAIGAGVKVGWQF